MTECSSPPDQDVAWEVEWKAASLNVDRVTWPGGSASMVMVMIRDVAIARTAWLAHQQVKGAPAFGSCRVVRVKGEEK